MKTINKEEAIKKINKYGKIGKILTTIGIIVSGISLLTTIVALIAVNVMPQNLITLKVKGGVEAIIDTAAIEPNPSEEQIDILVDAVNSDTRAGINLGAVSFELKEAYAEGSVVHASSGMGSQDITLSSISIILITAIVALILTAVSLVFGRKLCKEFQLCSSPFDEKVINGIRYFAFSLIPWALFANVPDEIAGSMFSQNINIANVNMDVVLLVLIILALSVVFKYGAILQQESDETL